MINETIVIEALEEDIATEETDWHDEVTEFGVDPNCYGAGFHAGFIEGLTRAIDIIKDCKK